jgi:nucleotidyltransferase substrate binding protein (TIGR01987 family)
MNDDVRWQQRLQNFQNAKAALGRGVSVANERALSELEQQGLIQAFDFTHELAWKVLNDYLADQGHADITGSKDATRAAFAANLLSDGTIWMDMIRSRNLTSHTYNLEVASDIARQVRERFWPAFQEFETRLLGLAQRATP